MHLADRSLVPGGQIVDLHRVGDRRGPGGRHLPVFDCRGRRGVFEEVAQRGHGALGVGQVPLQPGQMGGDELAPGHLVRCTQHRADLLEGHPEITESADHLGGRDLVAGVPPVPGHRVDVGRFEQAHPVERRSVFALRKVARENSPIVNDPDMRAVLTLP